MSELLIIDDDESLIELLGSFLANQGYTITVAKDGKEEGLFSSGVFLRN